MKIVGIVTVLMLLVLVLPGHILGATLSAVASNPAGAPVYTNVVRDAYEEWTVQVMPGTAFFPMGDLPDPFFFDDLQPGQMVLAEGLFWNSSPGVNAYWIFIFGPGARRSIGNPPSSMTDYILGTIDRIDPENMRFTMWVSQPQGECRTVMALPNATFTDASPDQPLHDISFFDLQPGDPLMVHGYIVDGDMMKGMAFVRSDDWFGVQGDRDFETMEIYGWLEDKWIDNEGNRLLEIRIDTMTGDPNHQSFTQTMSVQGGEFRFPWGYLYFPPYALDETTAITVSGDFMFWWTLQNIYDFEPSLDFNYPVEIEIRYFNLPDNVDPDRVNLSYYDEETGRWRVATHMTHFPDEHCFRGYIHHFSRYSLSTNNRPLQEVIQGQ